MNEINRAARPLVGADGSITYTCSCCATTVTISRANMHAFVKAAVFVLGLCEPGDLVTRMDVFTEGLASGIDWQGPVSMDTISRVVVSAAARGLLIVSG